MGKQEYLSAGRFAALVGTTKETLFHYDEIGLFVPKRRGTNGYRYYAMDQMETFDVIGMLRELGMPLAEIRNYLEQRSPEKFGVLLEQEEKVVREKMQRLREMQRWIGEKKRFLAQASAECREAFEKDPFCPVGIHTLSLIHICTAVLYYTLYYKRKGNVYLREKDVHTYRRTELFNLSRAGGAVRAG